MDSDFDIPVGKVNVVKTTYKKQQSNNSYIFRSSSECDSEMECIKNVFDIALEIFDGKFKKAISGSGQEKYMNY